MLCHVLDSADAECMRHVDRTVIQMVSPAVVCSVRDVIVAENTIGTAP